MLTLNAPDVPISLAERTGRPASTQRPRRESWDTNDCESEIAELFILYDLRGDGTIHEDEFKSTQRLLTTLMGPKQMQNSLAELVPELPSWQIASRKKGAATSPQRPQRTARGLPPDWPGGRWEFEPLQPPRYEYAAGRSLGGWRTALHHPGTWKWREGNGRESEWDLSGSTGSPSASTRSMRAGLHSPFSSSHEALPYKGRSPSLEAYVRGSFQQVDLDADNVISFDEFGRWQRDLLNLSRKSPAAKKQRLAWLVRELKRLDYSTGRSREWRTLAGGPQHGNAEGVAR